jgi:hypothetical protein
LLVAFPEDGPPFGEPVTWAGYLHGVGFTILVLVGTPALVVLAVALRGDPRWRGYSVLSAVAAGATFGFLVVLVFVLEVATTVGIYGFFGVQTAWLAAMAWHFHSLGEHRRGATTVGT